MKPPRDRTLSEDEAALVLRLCRERSGASTLAELRTLWRLQRRLEENT